MFGVRINTATIHDVDTLVSLFKQTIDAKKHGVYTYIQKHVRNKQIRCLKTEDGIIGAYIYTISRYSNPYTKVLYKQRVCWLDQLMIFPWAQQRGYGKELMKDFLQIQTKEFRLLCLRPLINYYQQFNFEVVETNMRKGGEYFVLRKHI